MRPTIALLTIFYALLSGTSSSGDDTRWLVSLVDLVELDYEDHCEQRATASWEELIGGSKGLNMKLERDKAYGLFSRTQTNDVKSSVKKIGPNDDILRRKVKLILRPGDTLLNTEDWFKLVTFGDSALNNLRAANNYYCDANTSNCSLQELYNALTKQPDEATVGLMKESWEKNLPSLDEYLEHILPLLKNSSKQNGYNTVEEYWDSLVEYEGAILKARELWDSVKPLYIKLHKYVAMKLKGSKAVGLSLSSNLLRTLNGDDWTNIIDLVLPKHPDIYTKVNANLKAKHIGGMTAFKDAADLITHLQLGEIENTIFSESDFNGTCPPTIVNWCKPNKLRIASCNDVSLANYLDSFEAVMRIKHKELAALHSNNTYLFREAARYSAVHEAIPGFASLLALNPYALDRTGLYPYQRFSYNNNHHRLVLQLYMALRDLPKLNYYLALDEWRLKVLMDKIPISRVFNSWSEFRKNFSLLETSNMDFLGDPDVVFNRPLIGKFMGIILKYQIYESFAEEMSSDESDLTQHVAENSNRLSDAMMQGYGVIWPDLVSELLGKRENGLEYTGLTDYYRLLDEYLDNQLDPAAESIPDDYIEPSEPETPIETNENEIPVDAGLDEKKPEPEAEVPEDHENMIANDDKYSKYETSTVAVMEIKNPVPTESKNEEKPAEASYNTYWWIGIAVAIVIIALLIGVIAKKRQNHRKQLEKQRRETSQA